MRPASFTLLGSCVSTGPYYRFRPSELHLEAHRTGTSLVSLMSPPLTLEPGDLKDLKAYQCLQLEGDITKSALDCVRSDVDFFVLDFGDETCDLVRIGESFVTCTDSLRRSSFLRRFPNYEIIRRDDPMTTRLWMNACTRFCRGPLARIPQERIVLHRIQLASESQYSPVSKVNMRLTQKLIRGVGPWFRRFQLSRALRSYLRKKVTAVSPNLVACHTDVSLSDQAKSLNPVLKAYSDHFRQLVPASQVIEVPSEHRYADLNHRYGVLGLHYPESYDKSFIVALQDLAVQRRAVGLGRTEVDIAPGLAENEWHR